MQSAHTCSPPTVWWWTRERRWECGCGQRFWLDEDLGGRFWATVTQFNRA